MRYVNIVDRIFETSDSSATALISSRQKLSFGDLKQRTEEVAEDLQSSGFIRREGEFRVRVAMNCPNGIDHIILSLGVLAAGGCLVPVPDELTDNERKDLIAQTGCDVVLCGEGRPWLGAEESISISGAFGESALFSGIRDQKRKLPFSESGFAALNPALVRFSSGTTGQSKGVVLSHETLFERVTACNSRLRISPQDRVIWVLPMAHHFAVSIVLYLLQGATTVVLDSHFANDINDGIDKYNGTIIYGAPFHHQLMAQCREGQPHPGLRLAVSTAAPLPLETAIMFRERYEIPLSQGLGIIEVGLPFLNDEAAREKPMSVGLPQKEFEARLIRVGEDGIGEILLRGPGMFDAYLSPWKTREEVLDGDRWFHTCDLGEFDEGGFLTLRGRVKSVINIAGMKVFPEEVESVLNAHPAIVESRVTGVFHRVTGQVPVAELVAIDQDNPPANREVLAFCRERLSNYRVPTKLTWVNQLPKTASGKVKR